MLLKEAKVGDVLDILTEGGRWIVLKANGNTRGRSGSGGYSLLHHESGYYCWFYHAKPVRKR